MVELVQKFYDEFDNSSLWYKNGVLKQYQDIENQVFHAWNECFNSFNPKQSNSNTAKICSVTTVKYDDYVTDLRRSVICIDDVRSVFTNKHKFNVTYTDNSTYLSKDANFAPQEEEVSTDLFEGF